MKKVILVLAIVVGLSLSGFGLYTINQTDSSTENSSQNSEQEAVKKSEKIVFSEDGKTVEYQGEEGETALTTLSSLADVETETSDFGEFVTSINGVVADSSKEYWSFYVNGEYASEGAGTYEAKTGDKIKWQLEQLK